MRSLSILLCGYGWFAGIPEGETNNAERIARALDGEILARGDARAVVHGMTMPVLWNGAFEPVQAAIDELKPDLVLALGTDARASAMRPEPFGVNWRRGRDAGGNPEENAPIFAGEPDWLRGALPYEAMARAMPTQPLYACRQRERMLAAAADDEAREKLLAAPIAGMELEMMIRGTRAALEACLA